MKVKMLERATFGILRYNEGNVYNVSDARGLQLIFAGKAVAYADNVKVSRAKRTRAAGTPAKGADLAKETLETPSDTEPSVSVDDKE